MEIIIKIVKACLLTFFLSILFSCQKDEGVGTVNIAKVNVINAVVDGGSAKANVGVKIIPWASVADYQNLGGSNPLGKLYLVPTDKLTYLQVVPVSDTTKFWYDQMKQLDARKMYTLYLSGTPNNIKTSFHEEVNFPQYIVRDAAHPTPLADSIVNIRFVNLSPSGPQVDIKIQGKSSNEVSGLSYEAFTPFIDYPASEGDDYIVFEIRRSTDKELINTYYLYLPNVRFKSIAIIMKGIYQGVAVPYMDQYRADMLIYQ